MSRRLRALLAAGLLLLVQGPVCLAQSPGGTPLNGLQVVEGFNQQPAQRAERASIVQQHERQVIMFVIGAVLLLLLTATASVGIAVAVLGKPLFLLHMILAGLTVTMAIVHVIVGVVWFYPF